MASPCDVSDSSEVRHLVGRVAGHFGRLDIVVNAAAIIGPIGPLWQCDLEEWRRTLATNLGGTVHCCHAAIPHLMRGGRGKIINFSGGGAAAPRVNFTAYGIAKAGIVRLTETLAEELKGHQIDVNAIAPGLVDTQMTAAIERAGSAAGAESALIRELRDQDKGMNPAELAADLAVFLASRASDGLTGRLISAPHDEWRKWDKDRIARIGRSSWLTLRRLDRPTLRQLDEGAL